MQNKTACYKLVTDNDGNLRYQFFCDLSGALEYTSTPVNKSNPEKHLEKVWANEAKEHFNFCRKCGKWVNTVMFNADVSECVACAPWEEIPKFCPDCGKKVEDTENKCYYCGNIRRYGWGHSITDAYEKVRHENMEQYCFGPEAMKKIKVCRDCGASVDSELLFCDKCRKPLPAESLYVKYVHGHFVCEKCKIEVRSDYKFCPQCGERLIYDKT